MGYPCLKRSCMLILGGEEGGCVDVGVDMTVVGSMIIVYKQC